MRKLLISLSQIVLTRLIRLSHLYTWEVSANSIKLSSKKQYIFISNHQSRIDPFVIFGSLPLRDNIKIAPIKFMTAHTIYNSLARPILSALGCYPTYKPGRDVIDYSSQLVKEGFSLFIFPEGRRTLKEESKPRPGIRKLFKSLEEYPVETVLIYIQWNKKSNSFRRHASIKIAHTDQSIRSKSEDEIMASVYLL